jgi:transcription initiation factor TFIID subunit 2
MDPRYFHGVRTLAASALASCATEQAGWVGMFHLQKAFQQLFCFENSPMTRSNDFSDHRLYWLQCTIPQAMAGIRDADGKSPPEVKRFFLDKLKFNDNSNNQYSDSKYVAILMAGLAETLVENRVNHGINTDFSFGEEMEDLQAEADANVFKRAALNEIDRLRRIDEWIPSYRNLYTLASMRSLTRLIQTKVIPHKMAHFLRYTRSGNQDEVRLVAFDCLVNLGMLKNDQFLCYILHSFASEPSQFVRERLWRIIGRGLGLIALGMTKERNTKEAQTDGLMILDEVPAPGAQGLLPLDTVDGALASLQRQLSDNEGLQEAIIEALRSPHLSMKDFTELLDLCSRLYTASESLIITLKLPRYWKVEHLGEAKLRFFQINKFRIKQAPKLEIKRPEKRRSSIPSGESPVAKRQKIVLKTGVKPKATSPSPYPANNAISPVVTPVAAPAAPAAPTPTPTIVQPQTQLPSPTLSQPPSFTQPVPSQPAKPRKPSPAVPKSTHAPKPSPAPKKSKIVRLKLPTRKEQLKAILARSPKPKLPPKPRATPHIHGSASVKHSPSASARSSPAPIVKPPTPAPSTTSPPQPPAMAVAPVVNQAPAAPKSGMKVKLKLKMSGGSGG